MRITRRTDYAIHLIANLSEEPDHCLGLRALASDHGVTYAFARTVQQGLLKAGIIKAARGINGGIKLARPLDEITLFEVFEAAQGPFDQVFDCTDTPWCKCNDEICVSTDLWNSTRDLIKDHFAGITMESILQS